MSQENVDVARNAGDAFNAFMRGDLSSDALVELLDPQIEFHWHDQRTYPDVPQQLRSPPERKIEFFRHRADALEAAGLSE